MVEITSLCTTPDLTHQKTKVCGKKTRLSAALHQSPAQPWSRTSYTGEDAEELEFAKAQYFL